MFVHQISPRVAAFIATSITSLDDLQSLAVLVNAPERWWDHAALARELRVPEVAARLTLERLAGRNLLEIRLTGDVRYRFAPVSEDLRADAIACLEAYRSMPVQVVRAVSDGGV